MPPRGFPVRSSPPRPAQPPAVAMTSHTGTAGPSPWGGAPSQCPRGHSLYKDCRSNSRTFRSGSDLCRPISIHFRLLPNRPWNFGAGPPPLPRSTLVSQAQRDLESLPGPNPLQMPSPQLSALWAKLKSEFALLTSLAPKPGSSPATWQAAIHLGMSNSPNVNRSLETVT